MLADAYLKFKLLSGIEHLSQKTIVVKYGHTISLLFEVVEIIIEEHNC